MQQVNNRYREYTLVWPSALAEQIKREARARKVTEQQLIRTLVEQGLAVTEDKEAVTA